MCGFERAFRWQRAAEGRHAISNTDYPRHVFPGDEVRTLCGITAILSRDDFEMRLASGAPAPTCQACTAEWMQHENGARPRVRRRSAR